MVKESGFKARLAPSARDASGANVIVFGGFRLPETIVVLEGKGFEVDYDNYESNPNRKFSTSEEWWNAFASSGKGEWESCTFKEDLLDKVNNDLNLAIVINHFVGDKYSAWMKRKDISDLGGLSPAECIDSKFGMKRLRMLFLQGK